MLALTVYLFQKKHDDGERKKKKKEKKKKKVLNNYFIVRDNSDGVLLDWTPGAYRMFMYQWQCCLI